MEEFFTAMAYKLVAVRGPGLRSRINAALLAGGGGGQISGGVEAVKEESQQKTQ